MAEVEEDGVPVSVTMRDGPRPEPAQPRMAATRGSVPPGMFEIVTERLQDDGIATRRLTLLCVEDLTPEDEMDMSLGIPIERIVNPVWMQWAKLAATVRMIDGDPVPLPSTEAEVRVIMKRVGKIGMRAIEMRWGMRYAQLMAEVKQRAKKSRGM